MRLQYMCLHARKICGAKSQVCMGQNYFGAPLPLIVPRDPPCVCVAAKSAAVTAAALLKQLCQRSGDIVVAAVNDTSFLQFQKKL